MSTEGKISADSCSKMSQLCGTSDVVFLFLSQQWCPLRFFSQGTNLMLDFPTAGCCGILGLGTSSLEGTIQDGQWPGESPRCPRENTRGKTASSISKDGG